VLAINEGGYAVLQGKRKGFLAVAVTNIGCTKYCIERLFSYSAPWTVLP